MVYARSLVALPVEGVVEGAQLYEQSVHLDDEGSSSCGKPTKHPRFQSNPTRVDTTSSGGHSSDPESAYHQGILKGRTEKLEGYKERYMEWRRWWKEDKRLWEKCVIIVCILAAILVIIALALLLGLSPSKKAGRGSLTGIIAFSSMCVAAGMWAGDRSAIETFLVMNWVVVWGIFLTSQVDTLAGTS
jgi:energy-converting hydrogenase Eha subunit A